MQREITHTVERERTHTEREGERENTYKEGERTGVRAHKEKKRRGQP